MDFQEYKIITLNVNGLHNPVKRSKVIAKIKRENIQVAFWQETHLSDSEHEKQQKKWVSLTHSTPPTNLDVKGE